MVGCPCDGLASVQLTFEYSDPSSLNIIMQRHAGDAFEDSVQMVCADSKLRPDRFKSQRLPEICVYIITNLLRNLRAARCLVLLGLTSLARPKSTLFRVRRRFEELDQIAAWTT